MSKVVTRKAPHNATRIVKPAPLADEVYDILSTEIRKLSTKSRGPGLDAVDIKTLKELSNVLLGLDKAERERNKADALMGELQNLSKEELVDIVKAELGDADE